MPGGCSTIERGDESSALSGQRRVMTSTAASGVVPGFTVARNADNSELIFEAKRSAMRRPDSPPLGLVTMLRLFFSV